MLGLITTILLIIIAVPTCALLTSVILGIFASVGVILTGLIGVFLKIMLYILLLAFVIDLIKSFGKVFK